MKDEKMRNCRRALYAALFAAVALFPVVYLCCNALMSPSEIAKYYEPVRPDYDGSSWAHLHLIPEKISLESLYGVFLSRPDYLLKFWKSFLPGVIVAAGQCVVSCMAGFAFARYEFVGKKSLSAVLLVLMLLPVQVTLVPQYLVLERLHLLDTWGAVALPLIFSPLGTLWMQYVFQKMPDAPLEAARLDGTSDFGLLFRIAAPMSKGAILCLFTISFIDAWNVVEQPMTFLENQRRYPLSVFLSVVNDTNFSLSFAGGVLALVPVFLLFLLTGRNLAEGLDAHGGESDPVIRRKNVRRMEGGVWRQRSGRRSRGRMRSRAGVFSVLVLLVLAVCTGTSFLIERRNLTEVTVAEPERQVLSDGQAYANVVPSDCVFQLADGRSAVYIIEQGEGLFGPQTVVRERIVTVLRRDGAKAALNGAYSGGIQMALSFGNRLRDGQAVRVRQL